MLLSALEIKERVQKGDINIDPFNEEKLKNASYTFTLGRQGKKLKAVEFVDTQKETEFEYFTIGEEGFVIHPGDFLILSTHESLRLSDRVACILSMRGKRAQEGLNALSSSIFCEPGSQGGFGGHLSLEVINYGPYPIKVFPGINIVKATFFTLE